MQLPGDPLLTLANTATYTGAGITNIVQTLTGVLYWVYIDGNSDVVYRKSTDGGRTWAQATVVFAGTATALAIWYDRWSGIAAGLIHCAYTESVTDDTLYRTINTESADALSTQTSIFAGLTTAAGGALSITRARGGNVYCATMIDAGAEGGFFRLPNANVPNGAWDAARTTVFEGATSDQVLLLPGWNADNQDVMCVFWDASVEELSLKRHDDSANSWAETSIATGMTDTTAANSFRNMDAFCDLDNSRNVVAAWSATDAANADLRCWVVNDTTITETSTNIVLNSTDDQGLLALSLDILTGDWYAFYAGKSDGSETWGTATNIYFKVSTDDGATWGAETLLSNLASLTKLLNTPPRFSSAFGTPPCAIYYWGGISSAYVIPVLPPRPRTSYQAGVV